MERSPATRSIPRNRLRWNRLLIEQAEMHMHQQLYVIGRDIESRHGNLLIQYGATRTPSPVPHIPSLYTFPIGNQMRIAFRGFGVFIGSDAIGGIFVHRYDFRPRWMPTCRFEPIAWLPKDMPPVRRPTGGVQKDHARVLLLRLIEWFEEYEGWIQGLVGRRYRAGQLVRFRLLGNPVWQWNMVKGWMSLRNELSDDCS
jgi:hypothetical protein